MRFARFVPIAFICGQHGFALFAPYLAFFLAGLSLIRARQRARTLRDVDADRVEVAVARTPTVG
jgi:hypothetical protein